MDTEPDGRIELDRGACFARLATTRIGRVGITSGALPVVVPVAFVVDGERILVRCAEGSGLLSALRDAVVAFEADDLAVQGDGGAQRGWSVVVTGVAHVLDDLPMGADPDLVAQLEPADGRIVAISTDRMTGREVPDVKAG